METKAMFEDTAGRQWRIHMGTSRIRKCLLLLGCSPGELIRFQFNTGYLVDVVWLLCGGTDNQQGITFEQFMDAVPPSKYEDVVVALKDAIAEAFPQIDSKVLEGDGPFDPGELQTYMSSVLSQGSTSRTTSPQKS